MVVDISVSLLIPNPPEETTPLVHQKLEHDDETTPLTESIGRLTLALPSNYSLDDDEVKAPIKGIFLEAQEGVDPLSILHNI